MIKTLIIFLSLLALSACENDGHLRGSVAPSEDGKTYFSVIDDNGGQCGPILLDGIPWPHKIGEAAPIEPGQHEIHCGGTIGFMIPEGVIYKFDYWGP